MTELDYYDRSLLNLNVDLVMLTADSYHARELCFMNLCIVFQADSSVFVSLLRLPDLYVLYSLRWFQDLTRFNKIATQGAPQMAVDKEANSLSRVYSYYSKFNLCLFYV